MSRGVVKTKKFLTITLVSLAGLFIVIYLFSAIPTRINIQYPAIQYRISDSREIRKINIKITGKLYKRLFSDPKYIGSIIIDNYDFTSKYELLPPVFLKNFMNGASQLVYQLVVDGDLKTENFGSIWITDNFKTLNILVAEPIGADNQVSTDLIISAPAKTREEAIKITKALNYKEFQY